MTSWKEGSLAAARRRRAIKSFLLFFFFLLFLVFLVFDLELFFLLFLRFFLAFASASGLSSIFLAGSNCSFSRPVPAWFKKSVRRANRKVFSLGV